MEALVRNPTYNFNRRFNGYEPLDQHNTQKVSSNTTTHKEFQGWRNLSRRRKENQGMMKSFSYRRQRAKQRQIFLKSFKLTSMEDLEKENKLKSRKLKTVAGKVKTVAVSVVAFLRIDSFRSCNPRSAIAATAASSPVALFRKCF